MNKKIKIGTVGNSLVGKTSICRNYLGEEFSPEDIVTIGMEKYEKDVEYTKNEKTIKTKIHIYDTTGNERYEAIMINYIKKCDGVFLVYAINNEKSFNDIENWIKKMRELIPVDNYPIVLIGNKIDLEIQRVISKEKGEEIAKKYNFPFYETSAKTGDNINESFECLIDLIIQYKEKNPIMDIKEIKEIKEEKVVKIENEKKLKKKTTCCCCKNKNTSNNEDSNNNPNRIEINNKPDITISSDFNDITIPLVTDKD